MKSIPDTVDAVGPESVNELVFPLVATLCYWLVLLIDENGFDAGRAILDTENGLTCFDCLFSGNNKILSLLIMID